MPHDDKTSLYAHSLLYMAEAAGRLSSIEAELKSAASLISGNSQILKFMADPSVETAGKTEALDEMMKGRIDPLLVLFLNMILIENQISNLPAVSAAFSELLAARRRQISGELVSSVPLPEGIVRDIEVQSSILLNKDVKLHQTVDKGLLGGILIKVGDFVIDGTVDAELEQARTALLS